MYQKTAKQTIVENVPTAPNDLSTPKPVTQIIGTQALTMSCHERIFDEDLSEFERARRTSKTWSMGQD